MKTITLCWSVLFVLITVTGWAQPFSRANYIADPTSSQRDHPSAIHRVDVDGDGDLDVLSAFTNATSVVWYANDGLGNFGPEQVITTNANVARSIDVKDLDSDGDVDVVASAYSDSSVIWYANDGTGGFGPEQVIDSTAIDAWYVYAEDIDNDGDADIVMAALGNTGNIGWYPNNGTGTFGPKQSIGIYGYSLSMAEVADVDGDGDLDVLASYSDYYPYTYAVVWHENDGTGSFSFRRFIGNMSRGIAHFDVADMDGDGDQDVIALGAFGISWFANDGTGNFNPSAMGQIIDPNTNCNHYRIYVVDMDGDGDQDILSTSSSCHKIVWYANDRTGNFGPEQVITNNATGVYYIDVADLDGDGDRDVLAASSAGQWVAWYTNRIINCSGPTTTVQMSGASITATATGATYQ